MSAQQTQLDADPRLFSVLAALNAAGYDVDVDSSNAHPLREEVRKVLAAKKIDVLPELKRYVLEHKQAHPTAELSQYVSFALAVRSVPEFEFRFKEDELPPDVRKLGGFDRLMQRFHREAGIDELFARYTQVFDDAMGKYQAGATQAITEVNAYLRVPSVGQLGRSFKVLIDLLGAPNQILVKNFQDDFYLVLTPSAEPQIDYVRYTYFRFMIDPLTLKYGEELKAKRGLIDYAQNAGALDDVYKTDFQLLAGACLIKAIEARLAPASRRAALVDTALREGYVMAPAFFELLPEYEKQESSMRIYFPDLVKAINLRKEEKRLADVEFLKEKSVKRAKVNDAARKPEAPTVTGALKTIDDAEELIRKKDFPAAREMFLAAVKQAEFTSTKAKAYFGLARIAILQKQNEEGMKLFETALESQPEPHVRAMSHYYLGRMNELAGEPDQALEHFRNALATPGITSQAKALAEKAMAEAQKRRDNK